MSRLTPPTGSLSISYAALQDRFTEHLISSDKRTQINNYKTALKTWREALCLSESSLVGSELREDFKDNLEVYETAQKRVGIKMSTYRSRISLLRAVATFYESELGSNELRGPFSKVLLCSIRSAGYGSIRDFHNRCVNDLCDLEQLRKWCKGKYIPALKSIPIIREFEKRLCLKERTLTSRIPKITHNGGRRPTGLTSFGRKIKELKKKPYLFWTQCLEDEWNDVLKLMTSPYLAEGQKRNSVWTSSEGSNGPYFPTAGKVKSHLKSFFGFCRLGECPDPCLSGLGMKPEDMTIGLLINKRSVERYLEFQKVRAGNIYTGGTLAFITLVRQLLRSDTGYLYQHPELSKKVGKPLSNAKWWAACADTSERLDSIRRQLEQQELIVKGRDPEDPIKEILAQDRPGNGAVKDRTPLK